MNLKQRFSLFFSFLFSALLVVVMFTIYYLFANFREMEFRDRLIKKAKTTVKLLLEVKEVDYQLLRIIDRNTINRLYNVKTLVFDDKMKLLYSSIDDAEINLSKEEIRQISKHNLLFKRNKEYDIVGLRYEYNKNNYYVLISAEDQYGNTNLNYLRYVLLVAFVISISLVWLLSFYLSKKSLEPLDKVKKEIEDITVKNLNKRIQEPTRDDEMRSLSHSFNKMMDRIDKAYQLQKEFTGNASHELRTPIAKILAQLENILLDKQVPENTKIILRSIAEDTSQLSEIVTSLLLLSEITDREVSKTITHIRLDEVIFSSASKVSKLHSDFKLQFEIENGSSDNVNLEIEGDDTLLQIAFINLFRNAYTYSDDKLIHCVLFLNRENVKITITNSGPTPDIKDTSILFNTFTRGSNTQHKAGSGIGLSIVKRILQYHNASLEYQIPSKNTNKIIVTIPYSL